MVDTQPEQSFGDDLRQKQQVHEERLQTIESMPNLSDEVRAQLKEAEETRFERELFGISNS